MQLSPDDDVWLADGSRHIVVGLHKDIVSILDPITIAVVRVKRDRIVRNQPFESQHGSLQASADANDQTT